MWEKRSAMMIEDPVHRIAEPFWSRYNSWTIPSSRDGGIWGSLQLRSIFTWATLINHQSHQSVRLTCEATLEILQISESEVRWLFGFLAECEVSTQGANLLWNLRFLKKGESWMQFFRQSQQVLNLQRLQRHPFEFWWNLFSNVSNVRYSMIHGSINPHISLGSINPQINLTHHIWF